MSRANNKLGVLTAILHFFIVIGAGHGIGFLGLLEFFIFQAEPSEISFSLTDSYEKSLFAAALLGIIGQFGLIVFAFLKNKNGFIRIVFVFFLWLSFYYLSHSFLNNSDPVSSISFYTGLPFFIVSVFFLVSIKISKNPSANFTS